MQNLELQLQKIQSENPQKTFEIFEGKIREVAPDEGEKFWENPIGADPLLQRKYIGVEYSNYSEPESSVPEKFDTSKFRIASYSHKNPFTGEEKIIEYLEEIPLIGTEEIVSKILNDEKIEIPEHIELENKTIGEIIQKKVYDGNVNAELADLAEGVLKIIAVLVPIVGKEQVKVLFADKISKAREVSTVRVQCGLEPFDLSFLD